MTLYNKRVKGIACRTGWVYPEDGLRTSIKELKEQFPNAHPIINEIDKIFGKELTEEKKQ